MMRGFYSRQWAVGSGYIVSLNSTFGFFSKV
jgi:hypothetical protein